MMTNSHTEQLLKGKRIFYIEDNLQNLALIHLMLEQQGATVRYERWGKLDESIARLAGFMPDLILLDLMFPNGISGYDIFDGIRQHAKFNTIPIVAISASDPSIEMPKARAKGFAGFISKPINLSLFSQQMLNLMRGQTVWHAE